MIKRLYNKSGSVMSILNRDVANNEYYEIPKHQLLELAGDIYNNGPVSQAIESRDIWVNNGTCDILNITEAKNYCVSLSPFRVYKGTQLITECMTSVKFEGNVGVNQVSGETVVSIGGDPLSNVGLLYELNFVQNGSAQNKDMDQEACNIPSNETFALVPFNSRLVCLTYSNSQRGSDGRIKLNRAPRNQGANSSLVLDWTLRNTRIAYKTNFNQYLFSAGDKVSMYIEDLGVNSFDPVVKVLMKVINDNNREEFIENF